jgi:small-conductance mechanosensitive channel
MRSLRLPLLLALLAFATPARPQPEADLSTPRRALRHFIDSARAGDFDEAARVLSVEQRPGDDGAALARKLKLVLDEQLWIEWDSVSDALEGDPADGAGADRLGTIPTHAGDVRVRLVRGADGAWRFGPGTVQAIPALYAEHGPGWIAERLPPQLLELRFLEIRAWQWLGLGLAALLAFAVGRLLGAVLHRVAARLARQTRFTWDDRLVDAAIGPARLLLAIAVFAAVLRALHLSVPPRLAIEEILRSAAIVVFTWAGLRGVGFVAWLVEDRFARGADSDALAARGVKTLVMVLRRVAGAVVILIGGALVLFQFEGMRALGTSLLASAGVAGIVVGLAAQRSLSTLLAGIQLSITQPVRVGDVVIVEGEWGTVEEITLTYVIVKIWDLRRLVLPIRKFLEEPFQNWTRTGSDLLGTVFVHADYRVPVTEVRRELERFVATHPLWDHKVVGLQVTDTNERSVELRALVSAADAGAAWDLRCDTREFLVDLLQRLDGGRYLPRSRVEADGTRAESLVETKAVMASS